MPLSNEKLPNTPLTGPEVKQYALQLLADELEQRSVPEPVVKEMSECFALGMDRHFMFRTGTAYPGITIEISARLHLAGERVAFSIKPTFGGQFSMADQLIIVRSDQPPLLERDGDERAEAFTISTRVENPNLVRVHYHIPIIRTIRSEPAPGKMFPEFHEERLEYDPAEFGAPPVPTVKDESEEFEKLWGVRKEVMPSVAEGSENGDSVGEAVGVEPQAETSTASPQKHRGRKKGWNKQ